MYTLKIECKDIKELQQIVANLGGGTLPVAQVTVEPEVKTERKVKVKVVENEVRKVEEKTVAPEPAKEEQETDASEPSFNTVKDKMLELAKATDRDTTLEVLGKFADAKNQPVTRVTALLVEDYVEFLKEVEEAMPKD